MTMNKLLIALMACTLVFGSVDAEAAKRLGGGRSVGKQSDNVTQRQAAPSAPPAATPSPTQAPAQATTAAKPATPAATPPAPSRPWGAMLGGLAAGLGLAWLAHSLGLGAEFGQFLMFALLALVIMVVVGMIMRARRGASAGAAQAGGYAYQGAGNAPELATSPRQYSPEKVGNDASARPWEQNATTFDGSAGQASATGSRLRIGSALAGSQNWGIPADFDVDGFIQAAKRNFITLQEAWDRSDIPALRAMMTDEMTAEIRAQLAERESLRGNAPNHTDVVMLDAQLLGIEDLGDAYMASVEFSGMIREEPSAGPSAFREVWNMTKPRDGSSGWLVAGVQALQ